MIGLGRLRKAIGHIISRALALVPLNLFEEFLVKGIELKIRKLSPADGLRLLFRLDLALYPLYGRLAVTYGGGVHTKHRHTRYHDFFVNRIGKDDRVLDIGCGIGALAYDIAERTGAYVLGIDVNAESIAVANQRFAHPNVSYEVRDAVRDVSGRQFDVVVLSNVLEHVDERVDFLRRVVDAVRPVRFLLRVPLFERDWRVPLKKELGVDYRLDGTHHIEYTQETFTSEMTSAGLKIVYKEVRWGEIWAEIWPD